MKKLIYIVLVMAMITSCSQEKQAQTNVDDTLPIYDMTSYCHKQAEPFKKGDIDGLYSFSDSIFNHCLQEEKAADKWLKANWSVLSSKAKIFCKRAISGSDENYTDLKVCARAATCEEDDNNLEICAGQKKLKDILGH